VPLPPFHPAGVCLFRHNICPFVSICVAVTPLCVGHHRISIVMPDLALRSVDMLSHLERVFLAGARLLRGHPSDGCLGIRENRDPFRVVSSGCRLQRSRKGRALRIVGLLVVSMWVFMPT